MMIKLQGLTEETWEGKRLSGYARISFGFAAPSGPSLSNKEKRYFWYASVLPYL